MLVLLAETFRRLVLTLLALGVGWTLALGLLDLALSTGEISPGFGGGLFLIACPVVGYAPYVWAIERFGTIDRRLGRPSPFTQLCLLAAARWLPKASS